MRRAAAIGLGLLLLAAGAYALRTLQLAGVFRELEPHARGVESCRLVEGPVGPEDVTVHPETGVAFVSAADRRATARGEPVPGAIWSYELAAREPEPVNRTPEAGVSFQPHGLSLWRGEEGGARLFVISHPPGTESPRHTVELFDVQGAELRHRATFTHEELVMPNDLVAVGPEHFYLTSTHANPPGALQTLETFLRLPTGEVLFRGPEGWRSVASGLRYPNGIQTSPEGGTVYVASVTGRSLLVFERDREAERLALHRSVELEGGPDNVEVDSEGTLWIATHPKLLDVAAHRDDPSRTAPSQVVRLAPYEDARGPFLRQEVLLRTEGGLQAASAATRWRNRLLVGQIFGEGFLDCRLAARLR